MQTTTGTSTTLSMYCKSGVKQQQWDLDCLLTDRTCGTCRPAHRGRASTGCNCESELSTHNCPVENLQTGTSTTKYELVNLYGFLNKQDHGELPLRIGSVDDRDELQLRNRQTVYCTVWTMTPHVANNLVQELRLLSRAPWARVVSQHLVRELRLHCLEHQRHLSLHTTGM